MGDKQGQRMFICAEVSKKGVFGIENLSKGFLFFFLSTPLPVIFHYRFSDPSIYPYVATKISEIV